MKAPFSAYLIKIADSLKVVVQTLQEEFDYVSLLASDSNGFAMRTSTRMKSVNNDTLASERGFVVRVYKDGLYSEYSFNEFDPSDVENTVNTIRKALHASFAVLKASGTKVYETPVLDDEPIVVFEEFECEQLPEEVDMDALMAKLTALCEKGMELGEDMIDVIAVVQSTHVSKMFLTKNRDMRQSYVISEGTLVPRVSKNGRNEMGYYGVSGRRGAEIFEGLGKEMEKGVRLTEELLDATRIEPGEYDIITTPKVSGLIAHEAFGHGVEMDMFVKDRALGAKYLDKRVGSDFVTMHEGANVLEEVSSYAFDDEGVLANDVTVIDHGILKTGICDALAALRLGIAPTGNGKRQNFEHKAYTRMTNTIFDSGESTMEEMIASIEYGYLLEGMQSGMEDPKHWGIQCIIERGYEIKDGKLTGKVVTPVVMTGYVPELLGSISMVSKDRQAFGSGACGKGHKEWVKVSDGGPCLKARARLG